MSIGYFLFASVRPWRVELQSKEPESFILSIELWAQLFRILLKNLFGVAKVIKNL